MIEVGRGDGAKPPLVIRSTSRLVQGSALLLLAVAIGAAYSEAPKGSKGSPLVAAVLGLVLAGFAVRLGAVRVTASSEGLVVRNAWRTRRISWWDVLEIQVVALSWGRTMRLGLFSRAATALTLHLRGGDEVLLEATVRRRWRETGQTYGPPFDRWLAALGAFRAPYRVSWN